MLWFYLALVAAFFSASCAITSKYNLSHYLTSPMPYMSVVGSFNLMYAVITFLFFGGRFVGFEYGAYALLSGIISFFGFFAIYYALNKEEVSRIVGIFQSFPLLVAILAIIFLGELLTPLLYLAIFLVIIGSLILSFRHEKDGIGFGKVKRIKGLGLILVAIVILSVCFVIDKYVLINLAFNHYLLYHFLGFGVMGGIFSLTKACRRELKATFGKYGKKKPLKFIVLGEVFGLSNFMTRSLATLLGPVSLVATITSTQPLFALFILVPLVHFIPGAVEEEIDRKSILLKLFGIVIILVGIYLIS